MTKRLLIGAALLLGSFVGHAQAVPSGTTMYVNADVALVYENPLKAGGQQYGWLRAGDSVQVQAERLPTTNDSFGVGKQYISVTYPAYATLPAGSGWLSRKYLTSQRDSITVARRLTQEEVRQRNAAALAQLQTTVHINRPQDDGKIVRVVATGGATAKPKQQADQEELIEIGNQRWSSKTGHTTLSGSRTTKRRASGSHQYITGPRGGCYYINSNGRKQYVDRSLCQ